jgi:hypothetical protein
LHHSRGSRKTINHIRISGYNLRGNESVEATHRPICEALIETGRGSLEGRHKHEGFASWAERTTTSKAIGISPFCAAHRVEPLLSFDLPHATHLVPDTREIDKWRTIGNGKTKIWRRHIHEQVMKNPKMSVEEYIRKNKNKLIDYDFQPGEWVPVLNKSNPAKNEGREGHAGYMGPWIVVYCLRSGAYQLAELNGAVSHLKFAAFRLVPYYPRNRKVILMTQTVDLKKLGEDDDEGVADADDEDFK